VELRHYRRCFRHCVNDVIGKRGRVWAGESDALKTLDRPRSSKKLAESVSVTKLNPIGIDVLAQQRHFDGSVIDEGLNLGQDIPRAPILLLTPKARDNAKRAGVVASHRDGDPPGVTGLAFGGESGGERLESFENLYFCFSVVA